MSIYSKVYSVKSNAARAAKPHGLTRADLEACDGGWRFTMPNIADELPEPVVVVEEVSVEPVTEMPAEPETALETSAPRGWDMVEGGPETHGGQEVAAKEVEADLMSAAVAMMAARRAIGVRKSRPGRRRKENGIGAQVISELKARWTEIDELVKMTGWEPHTTRAFISVQSRKLDLRAERKRVDGVTSYRLVA